MPESFNSFFSNSQENIFPLVDHKDVELLAKLENVNGVEGADEVGDNLTTNKKSFVKLSHRKKSSIGLHSFSRRLYRDV